jgi:hypothetical protein
MWVAMAAVAAAAAGTVIALFGPDGEEESQPNGRESIPSTAGVEEGIRFEVLSGRCGYEVVVTPEVTVSPENGQFCLVRLDVRNRGDVPRSFDPSCQFLIDTAGGRHTQREDVLPLDEESADFFEQELPPNTLASDIALYYDVAMGIEAEAVEMHTSCGSPGLLLEAVD